MRDYKVNILKDNQGIDLDIVNGEPAYLDYESQTQDQRAALAAYTVKGTVPGALDYGVGWSQQFTQQNTVLQLNNEVQLAVQNEAVTPNSQGQTYNALLLSHDGAVGAVIMRG